MFWKKTGVKGKGIRDLMKKRNRQEFRGGGGGPKEPVGGGTRDRTGERAVYFKGPGKKKRGQKFPELGREGGCGGFVWSGGERGEKIGVLS